jgi:hypothetical protein
MQNIPITLAAPGMVLAQEIRNNNNPSSMLICGKGIKLTESLLNRLQQMGIQSVSVEGRPVRMEGEPTVQEMLASLDMRFSRVNDDALMMKVKALYKKQILRSIGEPDAG